MQKNQLRQDGGVLIPRDFFAARGIFTPRSIAVMGLMAALGAVLSRFGTIYITPTFKGISLVYLPGVAVAMLYGPWPALLYGFVGDFIGYIANPVGGYFPGYAISEMASCFIYSCLLYRRPYDFKAIFIRAVIARAIIIAAVFLGLNYVWQSMTSGTEAAAYFTGARLINNLVQLPFHALLITYTRKLLVRVKPFGTPWL